MVFIYGIIVVFKQNIIGDRYEGEWKECLKHGNGTDTFSNGDVYVGQYKHGKYL